MALEEPAEDDLEMEVDGYKFIIGDGLEQAYDKFVVNYSNSPLRKGFIVSPGRG